MLKLSHRPGRLFYCTKVSVDTFLHVGSDKQLMVLATVDGVNGFFTKSAPKLPSPFSAARLSDLYGPSPSAVYGNEAASPFTTRR